jgi:NADH-quinone oxidoreductase subunit J
MTEQIAFGVVAAVVFLSGLMVVTDKKLVHAVLWLAVTLLGTAALYVLLSAPFLAGVQVLLYTGGIVTLMLFGVMLTRRQAGIAIANEQNRKLPGLTVAAVVFGIIAATIYETDSLPAGAPMTGDTAELGRSFLTDHLMAFEVLSLLLLAAMIGAIVIARRSDPQPPPRRKRAAAKPAPAAEEAAEEAEGEEVDEPDAPEREA